MKLSKNCFFVCLITVLLILSVSGCRITDAYRKVLTSFALDTVVSVTVYREADEPAAEEALSLCSSYEKIFSRTDEESELFRLNQSIRNADAPDSEQFSFSTGISDELFLILSCCRKYASATGDTTAFDCTLGALSASYNFSGETHHVPDAAETNRLLSHSGMDKWALESPNTFIAYDRELTLDLGAIAKGYIADRMKEQMINAGVNSAIINLGGNILLIGSKPDGSDFEIGIADPENNASALTTLKLSDCAMVTSGTYQRSFELDGQQYHHILDPSTGYPVNSEFYSVTVIADNSTDADAFSTALFVLGPEKEKALKERFSIRQVIWVDHDRNLR